VASRAEGPFQPHHAHVGAQAGCAGRKVDPATGDGDPGASRPQCNSGLYAERIALGAGLLTDESLSAACLLLRQRGIPVSRNNA
jgi:hypothetical protein